MPTTSTPVGVVGPASAGVMVTPTPPVVMVIVVPAVSALLVAAGWGLLCVALIPAVVATVIAAVVIVVLLGRPLPMRRVVLLPRAAAAGELVHLWRGGHASIQLDLLHVQLPHHIVHLKGGGQDTLKKLKPNKALLGLASEEINNSDEFHD